MTLGTRAVLTGVRALILVGLERVANLEQLMALEFGRGFMYNRPLRLNLLDLDYELAEQLVSSLSAPRARADTAVPGFSRSRSRL